MGYHVTKGKKQKIPHTNYYGCELHRWHFTSGKYTAIIWSSKNLLPLKWCFTQTQMQWFTHLMGDNDFFDIVTVVLKGDTLAAFERRCIKQKWFYKKKKKKKKRRSSRCQAETITDADNADHLALLANTPAQTESQLHSQEQTVGAISLLVNADKTEFMCFRQEGLISTFSIRRRLMSRQVHVLQKQCLICWKWCQHTSNEALDSYWLVIDYTEVWSTW